jgi:nitrogenase molybdenum-iron protein NifN
MFIKSLSGTDAGMKRLPALVHVSTPSYQGTHMQGFHGAVLAPWWPPWPNPPAGLRIRS